MYQGQDFLEFMKHEGNQQAGLFKSAATGYITSIDATKYTAKVMLQPIEIETGWLPIGTLYAGQGFGLVALPDINTEVTVIFDNGDIGSGKIICCNFNGTDAPPQLQLGQAAFIHKSGAALKFNNDGTVELCGNTAAIARIGDSVQVTVPGIGTCTGTITSGSNKVKVG